MREEPEDAVVTCVHCKRLLVRWSYLGATYSSVWSSRQIEKQAAYLRVPEDKFFFIAYKSNHSKRPALDVPTEHFVFAGGNSSRDYETLFKAFGRALRMALEPDPRMDGAVPSTKGTL